ncbi:MAG: efflux RND transporter periplasmic adaptor subunit [Bacteroidaceae bacterium]|nr:efflux RND transporter periplasmic adaptor subunit [Bacteroidaceae bacterium]MBR5276251.1 efflux RND transporter periplasmic adaptor subunit [Bacteroidaceae bacterium]MBR5890586.1 efflux RND transporter periplasmic adaptor subunit [Bacteroidaceae bacterium]
MDREIPKKEKQKKMLIRIGKIVGAFALLAAIVAAGINYARSTVNAKSLTFSTIDHGTIETSVTASGEVHPAFEEIINSPISSRIVEVYCHSGDSVDVGTPLLRLDLTSTENEYKKLLDEKEIRRHQLEQLKLNNKTALSSLEMNIKINAMELNRLEAELNNERYLDSIGSGTADKVRQAEMAVQTARLRLEQQREQLKNDREIKASNVRVQELEFAIFTKKLEEMKRTFDDARILSPRKAVLTYINEQIGAQVGSGSQIAIISDLGHYIIKAQISDAMSEYVSPGKKCLVKIGTEKLEGRIGNVAPKSLNGSIQFEVRLINDNHKRLRPGVRTDVYIMNSIHDDVLRIRNASYYVGAGTYNLFVRNEQNELIRRKVKLGDSNFDHVEVVEGLQEGDQVVISDVSTFAHKEKIKLK